MYEIAHSRTGDKGNISNISLIAFDIKDFERLRQEVTAARVKAWLGNTVAGEVVRYELPQLGALNFVLNDALSGGVTASTALDPHGKTLGAFLLEMEISGRITDS